MNREEICKRIEEVGIMPGLRVHSEEDAIFGARAVASGGIPIVEITMTTPHAVDVIARLRKESPEILVGAGTVLNQKIALECINAGAQFLTSPGLDVDMVGLAHSSHVCAIPGALTPTEVNEALQAGADFVKIFPCAPVGGASYIRALRAPFPTVRFIASGGVTQQTATEFILGGTSALGIGEDLVPREALQSRKLDWIHELSRRFVQMVKLARKQRAAMVHAEAGATKSHHS